MTTRVPGTRKRERKAYAGLAAVHATLQGDCRGLGDSQGPGLLLVCLLIAAFQAVVFAIIEGWSLIDGFHFAVVTMATVGYGDFTPQTFLGKLLNIAFMFVASESFVLAFLRLRAGVPGPDVGKAEREGQDDA